MQQISNLKIHMVIHSGEKLHKCAQCNKSFNQVGNLKRHFLAHSGKKLHNCAQCSKSFTEAATLKRHLLTHSGEKTNKCAQCNYSTALTDTLRENISHWCKATPMQPVRIFCILIATYEATQNYSLWRKVTSM